MSMEIMTYANNQFDVPVKVLGLAFFPQRQNVLLPTLTLFTMFYSFVADKSCTLHSR